MKLSTVFTSTLAASVSSTSAAHPSSNCYCFPGDTCWLTISAWAALNHTVRGQLIATVPMESPCHAPNYDAAACALLQGNWTLELVHFLGRSTGAGALSVWTQHPKDIESSDWSDCDYEGKAVKVGAGVLGYEILAVAAVQGLVVISGECHGVGLAGGYTQGGGHSASSTTFGLSADQTLEFEVVTAAGELVTASKTEKTDLYWALRGGGGGTYGVVTSMTVKAYPDIKTGGARIRFAAAYTTPDIFYKVISEFHALIPAMVDDGTMIVYFFNHQAFNINPVTGYNKISDEIKTILSPLTS